MTPGIYPNIAAREYFAEPCPAPALTCSTIKTLLYRTAAEAAYEHPALNPGNPEAESTAAKRFGDVAHQLALGKGRGYAIGEYDAWMSKDAKQFKQDAIDAGLTPIVRKKFDEAASAAGVMRGRIETTLAELNDGVVPDYQTEVVFIWREETPPGLIWCRAMADVWCDELGIILDPKFSARLSPGVFENHAAAMAWDLQADWYLRGMTAIFPERAGRLRFINLIVNPKPPHISRAMEADEATLYSCRMMIEPTINRFGQYLAANDWPGYPRGVETWTARSWTLAERATRSVTEEPE